MSILSAIQQFEVFECLLLESNQYTSDQLLVCNSFVLQTIWNYVVNVLDEDNVCIEVVQVFDQCTVTTRTEQQLTIVAEWLVFHISSNCISAWLLFWEWNEVFYTILSSVCSHLFFYQCLEQFAVFSRYSEVNIYLTSLTSSIKSTFYQVFFQRSTYAVFITMELQQALWKSTIVQTSTFEQVSNNCLIVAFSYQSIDTLTIVLFTSSIQITEESEVVNVFEELLFKWLSRNIVFSTQEFEHILEHTASSTWCRYKLHDILFTLHISIPCFQICLHFFFGWSEDTFFDRCSSVKFQEWETLFEACQLFCDLFFWNAFLFK